ncbi:MAG: hypothetical protein K6U14_10045 [Firmicutes bacterium]|nr:hypothetical protein [Alicyclobacillaceae bacterium]MCL6497951.1 hypothetical protein [Bacillota bacterium]
MNRFQYQIAHVMDPVTRLLETTTNPHHRRILENYRLHVHLELAGEFDRIVAPDLMVDEPVYRINWGKPVVLRGKAAVVDFYRAAQRFVMWNSDDQIAVADWGLADELTFHFLATGHILAEFGVEVPDKDRHYHFQTRQAFIWPYDAEARLIGEHLYVDATSATVEPIDPSDLVTPEWVQATHRAILAELEAKR